MGHDTIKSATNNSEECIDTMGHDTLKSATNNSEECIDTMGEKNGDFDSLVWMGNEGDDRKW
jgi:hypothetical protein